MGKEKKMEGSKSCSNNNVRWNPTKEQISILEVLYVQGMRTPTADQIQRITSRLRCYGHIEGKNVFYWFQNHKARQRQKEKQRQRHHHLLIRPQQRFLSFARVNRRCLYFHNSSTVAAAPALLYQQPPSSSTNNAVFGPCYVAQNDMPGYNYPRHPIVIHPPGSSERRMNASHDVSTDKKKYTVDRCITKTALTSNETLDLFPVHPYGIQHERKTSPSANQYYPTYSENCAGNARREQPLFDFFSANNR